jgi:hypothetical protein
MRKQPSCTEGTETRARWGAGKGVTRLLRAGPAAGGAIALWPALVGLGFRQRDEQEKQREAGRTDSALGAPGVGVGMALTGGRRVSGCAEGLLVAGRRKP